MIFHKVTQEEITNAKHNGEIKLVNKLAKKFVKQHRTQIIKRFDIWISSKSSSFSIYISILALIISIIALFC